MSTLFSRSLAPRNALIVASFAALALIQTLLCLRSWPQIGDDYSYFIPRLLDVQLHYTVDGLGIQWWTPSFGGGLPAFANWQHTQFMPAQLLVALLGPLPAVIVSSVMMNTAGGLLVHRFCAVRLSWCWQASFLAGLGFAANGFSLMRLLVGHLPLATLPLVAAIPFLLGNHLPRARAVGAFGLLWTVLVFAGGYTICIIAGLSLLLLAAGLSSARPGQFNLRECAVRAASGIALGAVCCAVKLAALGSWLSQIPRPGMYFPAGSLPSELGRIVLRLGAWEWLAPLNLFNPAAFERIMRDPAQGSICLWEQDQALALPLWLCIGATLPALYRRIRYLRPSLLLAGLAALWVTLEFCLARGPLWSLIHSMPGISSLHANWRFNAAFILPLVLLSGWAMNRLAAGLEQSRLRLALFAMVALILASQAARLAVVSRPIYHAFDSSVMETAWRNYRSTGTTFSPITVIADTQDDKAFPSLGSSLRPYEPIFGYGRPGPGFRTPLRPGPIEGPSFNLHHPAAFLSPTLAGVQPFMPPPQTERARVRLFLQRHQPDWPLPPVVRSGMGFSLLGILSCLLLLFLPAMARPRSL